MVWGCCRIWKKGLGIYCDIRGLFRPRCIVLTRCLVVCGVADVAASAAVVACGRTAEICDDEDRSAVVVPGIASRA